MNLCKAAAGLFSILMILFFCASSPAGTNEEIVSLLQFVEQSNCIFIRNGKQYDALESREHIEKKYNFYKEKIATAEDFILYSATKSIITGKQYKVICNGVSMNSSDWLTSELERLRAR